MPPHKFIRVNGDYRHPWEYWNPIRKKQAQILIRHTRPKKELPNLDTMDGYLAVFITIGPSDLSSDTWCVHRATNRQRTPNCPFSITWSPLWSQLSPTATCLSSSSCEAVWPWSFETLTQSDTRTAKSASLNLGFNILSTETCLSLSVSQLWLLKPLKFPASLILCRHSITYTYACAERYLVCDM